MNAIHAFFADHRTFAAINITILLIAVTLWDLIWKGVGLWFSARNKQKAWFVGILILNTLGILPIIYLIWFRRDKKEGATKSLFESAEPAPVAESPEA